MYSAGFGAPGISGETDQPWGHHKSGSAWWADQSDCAEALGPAGRVHCTIEDWAKFLSLFLTDKNPILKQEYINKLIEPIGFYAGGWGVADKTWAKGDIMSHNGSNGIWYSSVLVAPKLDRAFIVCTNSRDFGNTEDLCSEMITKLIRMELKISGE
ncbi:MAG: penicillin-binding protein, partial [Bacteroidetes bacterium]|nr:penicillin-binding protein [Bacteroidota bacterium]